MNIAVFCGSRPGTNEIYQEAARKVGELLAKNDIGLVYGGGRVGLMGTIADSVLANGGQVIGVMPRSLVEKEIAHTNLTELHVVESMHERKAMMADLASGFIALPGGAGTLEEIFEQWTWAQLGIHAKPCGFLNINGYFDAVKVLVERIVSEGFMEKSYGDMLIFVEDVDSLLAPYMAYTPPPPKWTDSSNGDQIKP